MITLLIFLIGLFFIIKLISDDTTDKGDKIGGSIMIMFLAIIINMVILTVGIEAIKVAGKESGRTNYETPIYSLRNQDNISGSFFLGSGRVSSTEYFYTFAKNDRGGIYRVQIPAYNCEIFQRSNEVPRLSWQEIHYSFPWWLHLYPKFSDSQRTKYDIIVPENTIIEEFKLN